MNIAPAVLTWNAIATGRADLLRSTVESIRAGGVEPIVVTNGSTDGTDKLVREYPRHIVDNSNGKMWYGCTVSIFAALDVGTDIVMFSADDITYHEGWHDKLAAFWAEAPEDVKLAGLFIEPDYPWAKVRGVVDAGGVRGLVRDTVPSASWTFRASDWPLIRDPQTLTIHQQSPGEDHATNERLRKAGYRLVQLDLAEHAGEYQSAWGNQSAVGAKRLDLSEWGM